MAFADLSAARPSRNVYFDRGCQVCQVLDSLPEGEAAALRGLLSDRTWRYSDLSEALRNDPDNPVDLPSEALSRHARAGCSRREKLRG